MRKITALFAAAAMLALPSCTTEKAGDENKPSARYVFWRPSPVAGAPDPAETVKSASADQWVQIKPEDLLVLDFADGKRAVVQLAPDFAPTHAANVRAFARSGWWQGSAIYRVQDNYVTQWGLNETEKAMPAGVVALPPAEYDRPLAGLSVRPLGYPDSYAPMAGHANGWPVAYDPESGRAWLPHCYGMVGVARDLAPDTGSGSELYTIIGQAPRHLDLNIAIVGRVIDGMEALSARTRGTEALGFYKDRSSNVPIARTRLAADIPAAERPSYEVLRSDSEAFSAFITGRANRGGDFFKVPAGSVDVCNAPVPVRRRSA